MSGEEDWELRRQHPRVMLGFMVWHRVHQFGDVYTEFSTIKNISLGGCLFSSQIKYDAGQCLDLKIKLPGFKDLLLIQAEVRRCEDGDAQNVWFIAVQFLNMSDTAKSELTQRLDFFVKKQSPHKDHRHD